MLKIELKFFETRNFENVENARLWSAEPGRSILFKNIVTSFNAAEHWFHI